MPIGKERHSSPAVSIVKGQTKIMPRALCRCCRVGPSPEKMNKSTATALRIGGAILFFGYGYHLIIQRSKSRGGSISRDGFNFEAMWSPVTTKNVDEK